MKVYLVAQHALHVLMNASTGDCVSSLMEGAS